jgi:Protein of unknown function (DUF2442)
MDTIEEHIIEAATKRSATKRAALPAVVAARYDRRIGRIVLALDSGLELAFAPRLAEGFEHAKAADLDEVEISPSGLGVHFPKIDADIYLPGLLDGLLGSKRYLAARNGKLGGAAKTPAKRAASRENGKLGGRPRKTPPPDDDGVPDAA